MEIEPQWLKVEPVYRRYLIVRVLIALGGISGGGIVFFAILGRNFESTHLIVGGLVAALLVLTGAMLQRFMIHRRYERLRYYLSEESFNVQAGYLFWHQTAVPLNRIQHVEVDQGPLQRFFGLASLTVFTAGTTGSDLELAGISTEQAQRLKAQLITHVVSEEVEDE